MHLSAVGIAGADNQTDPDALFQIAEEYPEVEFGILFTKRSGRPAIPSPCWIDQLCNRAPATMRLCAHICSAWARDVCRGLWTGPRLQPAFRRIQLNIGKYMHEVQSPKTLAKCLPPAREYIVQVARQRQDGLDLAWSLQSLHVDVSVLFDASGGKGRLPRNWPEPVAGLRVGYAGGLGPETLLPELVRLEPLVGNRTVWIDMQSGVRTRVCTKDSKKPEVMDLRKVRSCLEIARGFCSGRSATSDLGVQA